MKSKTKKETETDFESFFLPNQVYIPSEALYISSYIYLLHYKNTNPTLLYIACSVNLFSLHYFFARDMSDDSSSTVTKQKRTMGRKKIDIKKIQNTSSFQVTFSKRRTGLFRKASQLGALCGAEMAILVFAPHGRPFVFGHPSVDSVISRLASTSTSAECMHVSGDDEDTKSSIVQSNPTHSGTTYQTSPDGDLCLRTGGCGSMGLVKEETEEVAEVWSGGHGFWWDQQTGKMKLHELKQLKTSLEDLRAKVGMQLDEMARRKYAARNFLGVNRNGSCG